MKLVPRLYNFFMPNSIENEFYLIINVRMPTINGILTFISRKKAFSAYLSLKKVEFLYFFFTYEHLKFHAQFS